MDGALRRETIIVVFRWFGRFTPIRVGGMVGERRVVQNFTGGIFVGLLSSTIWLVGVVFGAEIEGLAHLPFRVPDL